jgi:hypothetical protein
MTDPSGPGRHEGPIRRALRRIKPGDTYSADEDVELDAPDPDDIQLPEADQVGDLEHEGGPDDGGN